MSVLTKRFYWKLRTRVRFCDRNEVATLPVGCGVCLPPVRYSMGSSLNDTDFSNDTHLSICFRTEIRTKEYISHGTPTKRPKIEKEKIEVRDQPSKHSRVDWSDNGACRSLFASHQSLLFELRNQRAKFAKENIQLTKFRSETSVCDPPTCLHLSFHTLHKK